MCLYNTFYLSILLSFLYLLPHLTLAYWDLGTTTAHPHRTDNLPRQSFFRWQQTFPRPIIWSGSWDWEDIEYRRRLNVVAGISIDFLPLGTATIMNRRILITSANYLDPHLPRQRDLRIWALGRSGEYNTPYRYRVWRVWRPFPKSSNPEHFHGPRGVHVPRHDIAIILCWDQMYIYAYAPTTYMYPYKATLTGSHDTLSNELLFAGSGFEYKEHIRENYKIVFALAKKTDIVDCSVYLPKWWGKFICIRNTKGFSGVPNGGGLFSEDRLVGVGCFEIRYNEDRIMVFTDLRYYVDVIYNYSKIWPGSYYEYAYPQWGIMLHWMNEGSRNYPFIPYWQMQNDLYPLG